MVNLFRQKISIALALLIMHSLTVSSWAMAKEKITASNRGVAAPQSRMSTEIALSAPKDPGGFQFIKKYKWWIVSGLSIVAAGVIVSSGGSGSSDSSGGDDGGTTENEEFGSISGSW